MTRRTDWVNGGLWWIFFKNRGINAINKPTLCERIDISNYREIVHFYLRIESFPLLFFPSFFLSQGAMRSVS